MNQVLETVGSIAGIGGLALGVFLLLYKRIILPKANRKQLTLFMWLVFLTAVLGMILYSLGQLLKPETVGLGDKTQLPPKKPSPDEREVLFHSRIILGLDGQTQGSMFHFDDGDIRETTLLPTTYQQMHVELNFRNKIASEQNDIVDVTEVPKASISIVAINQKSSDAVIQNLKLVSEHSELPNESICFWYPKGLADTHNVQIDLARSKNEHALIKRDQSIVLKSGEAFPITVDIEAP